MSADPSTPECLRKPGRSWENSWENVEISDPQIPYVANVTASYVTDKAEVKSLLARTGFLLRALGAERESDAGGTAWTPLLRSDRARPWPGFMRKITRDAKVVNIETLQDVKALKESGL